MFKSFLPKCLWKSSLFFIIFSIRFLRGQEQQSHPCDRPCIPDGPKLLCQYYFDIEKWLVRSKACYYCPFVVDDCYRPECVAADGVRRMITVINRQLPGPAIKMCDGDKVEVVLKNSMSDEVSTIHWHGINQHTSKSPYMDGVAFITQCPVLPGCTFVYRFEPDPPGTHLYHAHVGTQRADGVFGAFILRKPKEWEYYGNEYDFDMNDHIIVLCDWIHEPFAGRVQSFHQATAIIGADTILVNGRSRYEEFIDESGQKFYTPISSFWVQQGFRYLFRVVNAGLLYCPIEIMIDNHKLKVIRTDGFDIEMVEVDSLVTFAGERWDFILDADKEIGNYWMKFKGLKMCEDTGAFSVAILHYEGADDSFPQPDVTYDSIVTQGIQLNPVNIANADENSLTLAELRSVFKGPDRALGNDFIQLILGFDFYAIDHPIYHKTDLYGFEQVNPEYQIFTQQINHISMKMPPYCLLSQPEYVTPDSFCNQASMANANCETEFCSCIHVESLPLNKAIEIILVDEGTIIPSNHPFHLHGFSFRVVATDVVGESTTVDQVLQMIANNEVKFNFVDPIFKDTLSVPNGGFAIIRFYTDNPGYWFFHCHLELHAENGMGLVFKVGDYGDFPPVPENFPRCYDFWN